MAASNDQTQDLGTRPTWLTFDCYGTLIQWDEGLIEAIGRIFARHGKAGFDVEPLIAIYDRYEHALEVARPYRNFKSIAGESLERAMAEFGLMCSEADIDILTGSISAMPPFPEVPKALALLKQAGFKTCIISNTDDDIIAGTMAQLGAGAIDRVVTAEWAGAYKPARTIFERAWADLGIERSEAVHICASPKLDHTAARDLKFRCIWIDRGTGRALLPDYTPDMTLPTLDRVPAYFQWLGWMEK